MSISPDSILNLDILMDADPKPLVDALAHLADPLYVEREDGRFRLTLELTEHPRDAQSAIESFVGAIERLPTPARALAAPRCPSQCSKSIRGRPRWSIATRW